MLIYFFYIILSPISYIFCKMLHLNPKHIGFLFLVVPAVVLCGLRGHVGSDYHEYERLFYVHDMDLIKNFTSLFSPQIHTEPGFFLCNIFLKSLNLNFNTSLIFYSSISIFINFFFICKILSTNKKYFILSTIACFTFYLSHEYILKDFIQIRAGLASAFILISVYYLNSFKKFSLFYIIAISFHLSALPCIFLPIIYKIIPKISPVFLILLIFLILLLPLDIFVKYILDLVGMAEMLWKVSLYMSDDGETYALGFMHPTTIKKLLIIFLFCSIKKYIYDIHYYKILSALFFSITIIVTLSGFGIFAARVAAILSVFDWIALVYLFKFIKHVKLPHKELIVFLKVVLLSFLFLSFHLLITGRLHPYKPFFFQ